MLLEQLRNRVYRRNAHLAGRVADHDHAAVKAKRFEVALFGELGVHDDDCARAVGELRRVARRDRRLRIEHALELEQAFERGVRAIAFVFAQRDLFFPNFAALFVFDVFPGGQRDDLFVEGAALLRLRGALLALQRVLVLPFARHLVLLSDEVGRLQHRHVDVGLVAEHPIFGEELDVHRVLHHTDRLGAACDDDVRAVDDDALRRNRDRLQPRGAVAVDRRSRNGFGQAGAQCGDAAQIVAGRAFGQADADDDVVDLLRIHARTFDGRFNRVAGHRRAVRLIEGAAEGSADWGTRRGNNGGFTHELTPWVRSLQYWAAAGWRRAWTRALGCRGRRLCSRSRDRTTSGRRDAAENRSRRCKRYRCRPGGARPSSRASRRPRR